MHSDTASTDSAAVGLVKFILGSRTHRKVAAQLRDYDTWPNTDGHIEVLDDDKQPMGIIWAQAKGLPENHELKFPCPTGLFEFARQNGPTFLFGVDLDEERVYWNYYDEDIVATLQYAGKKTLTVTFDPSRSFTKRDTSYATVWKQLVTDRKAKIQGLRDTVKDQLLSRIDVSKQLLEKHRYAETVQYLTEIKNTQWDIADNLARFRILSALALALYQCDKHEDAAEHFLDAYKFDPGAPNAQSNRALAYLLKNDFKKALVEANELLEINPLNISASALKVLTMGGLGRTYKTIKASVDTKTLETAEVCFALGSVAQKANLTQEARRLFEHAVSRDDDPHIAFSLGTLLVEEITNNNPHAIQGMLDDTERKQVGQARDLLQKAWSMMPDIADRKTRSDWLFNQMVACRILGETGTTERVVEELLALKPDHDVYVKNAAIVALESGKPTVAEVYIQQRIGRGSLMPDLRLLLTEVFIAQEKFEKAEKELLDFLKTHTEQDSLWMNANQTLFHVYLRQEHLDKADQLAAQLTSQDHTKVLGLLYSARLASIKQDSEQATSLLIQAEAGLSEDTEMRIILEVAEAAYEAKIYEVAARAYERAHLPHVDHSLTRRYLYSLFESGCFQKTIDAAARIRKKCGPSRPITQLEWDAYHELQNLPAARKVLVQYVKDYPEDEEAKLVIAFIDFRADNKRALCKYLDEPRDVDRLGLSARIQLACLYQTCGRTKQMLALLYDTRKKFENDPDAHSAYVSLTIGVDDTTPEMQEPEMVQPNTVLLYDGGFFVVEADREPQIKDNEIDVAEATRRGFMDKKVGDKIELTRNHLIGSKEVRIITIQSKYVYALQTSMLNYERRFPQRRDLMSFNVEEFGFTPIFKQLDQTHDYATPAEQLYKGGKIPIDLFAKLVNRDCIEVFYALRGVPDLGVRVATGMPEEAQASQELFQKGTKRTIVADITALITFYELGLQPNETGLEKFVVAQTTHDLLIQKLAEERTYGKKSNMTLYKQNGKYIRLEMTDEQHRQRVDHIEHFAEWVNLNTTTSPLKQEQIDALRLKVPDSKQLNDPIAPHQLDTIRLATSDGSILYCDDLFLRTLAAQTFGTKGIWTQALLIAQLAQGKLDEHTYEESAVKLANSNYRYVTISPGILIEAAKQAKWLPADPFTRVLKALTRAETSVESMVSVLTNFLYAFYMQPMIVDRGRIIQQILQDATRHHNRERVLALLGYATQARFQLLALQAKEIADNIQLWRQLHNI